MKYEIEWKPKPLKIINKLPSEISLRIWNKIGKLKENPYRYLKHYEGAYYKLRVGDYRILLDLDNKNKILTVEILDKRSKVYKK